MAYIVSRYPAISHTFVQREVEALRRLGVSIKTFSVRAVGPDQVLSEADRSSFATTTAILPTSALRLLRSHLAAFRHDRSGYFKTLRFAVSRGRRDIKRTLWQLFYFAEAMILWNACERDGIRHIHAHMANVASDVARLAASFGHHRDDRWRWSFTMHGPTEFANVSAYGLEDKVDDADLIVCISDFCRSQLMALGSAGSWDNMHVVHCGIEPQTFARSTTERIDSDFHVLCVGRLVPEKGQMLLLEASETLIADGINVRVTLVGDGPSREVLAKKAVQMNGAVTLTGSIGQDQIREYYNDADVFCLASANEGVPVVLMEAMAMNIVPVSTIIAGIPELIEDKKSGLLVAPGRADLVADALRSLYKDPKRRAEMAKEARVKVLADFTVDGSAAQLRDIFATLR